MFQFNSFLDFLAMGGYGFYVWLAYSLSFLAVVALIWLSKTETNKILCEVKKIQQREQHLNKTNPN